MTVEPITIELTFPAGRGNVLVGIADPRVCVFRHTVETGKPTGRWVYLAVSPDENQVPVVMGTLAKTTDRRFLFFPGSIKREVWSDHQDPTLNGLPLDHLTLELSADMRRFDEHTAVFGAGKTRGHRRTGPVRDNCMHPWFSILAEDLRSYHELPARLLCTADVPSADKIRRVQSMTNGAMSTLLFPPKVSESSFLQVDVWAARGASWHEKNASPLPLVLESRVADGSDQQVEFRRTFVPLGNDAGIAVFFTRPVGKLRQPGVVSARLSTTSP